MFDRTTPFRLIGLLLMVSASAIFSLPNLGPSLIFVGDTSLAYHLLPPVYIAWLASAFIMGLAMVIFGRVWHWASLSCLAVLLVLIYLDTEVYGQAPRSGILLILGLLAFIEFMLGTGALIHGKWRRHPA